MDRKRLYLIDGMSHIYRAYYAIRNLSNSKGLPTNAVFGFTSMLRKLIEDEKPDYIGVAFDLEGPTVRHEMFEAYKATRKPMPEDLVQQLPYIRRVCEAFRVPVIGYPGYEADDVIGTLSTKAVDRGLTAIVVTSDKDMLQLVSDHIFVLDPRKENALLDPEKVVEKFGVRPDQVPDLLGLWGDASDNIPGAPGIGEKGARELIQTFGSLENSLKNWDKAKKKAHQESLRDNADIIRTSLDLATIRCDLPIELDLDALLLSPPERKAAFELFAEMEFKSLMQEFLQKEELEAPGAEWLEGEKLTRFLKEIGSQHRIFYCLKFRDAAFHRREAIAACAQADGGTAGLIDLRDPDSARAWRQLLETTKARKVCWDAKLCWLSQQPLVASADGSQDDVMLMAFLTAPHIGDYTIRWWAMDQLHVSLPENSALASGTLPSEPKDEFGLDLSRELDALRRLADLLSGRLDELGLRRVYEDIEVPLIPVLSAMERTGVKIDRQVLDQMSSKMDAELAELTRKIYASAGVQFNINSPKQLGEILFEKLNLPILKKTRKTGGYSTDQSVLEELAESYELPQLILEYRQISKLKSTYVDVLPGLIQPATGRVHTSFNQTGAATGRISSSDPNLQNIPVRTELGRLIRAAFIPEKGNLLVSADYSQVELRILAHLSGDPALIEAFQKSEDIHRNTAEEVFGADARGNPSEYRRRAKAINFGIIYGLSAFGLARQLGIARDLAQGFIDAYFQKYQGVRAWLDKTIEEARSSGHVRTLFGRMRPIPDIGSKDHNARQFAERTAVNSPIQGTAADIIKIAMVRLDCAFRKEKLSAKIILQVHDELVIESPIEESGVVQTLARREMEHAAELKVPLVVDLSIAGNWKDMK